MPLPLSLLPVETYLVTLKEKGPGDEDAEIVITDLETMVDRKIPYVSGMQMLSEYGHFPQGCRCCLADCRAGKKVWRGLDPGLKGKGPDLPGIGQTSAEGATHPHVRYNGKRLLYSLHL